MPQQQTAAGLPRWIGPVEPHNRSNRSGAWHQGRKSQIALSRQHRIDLSLAPQDPR